MSSLREHLVDRLRPLVETALEEIAELVVIDLETRITNALEAARSSIASDLAAADPGRFECAPNETPEPSDHPDDLEPEEVPKKRTNTCRKCGAIGFTARTCGVTHNVSTEPGKPDDDAGPPSSRARRARSASSAPSLISTSSASVPSVGAAPSPAARTPTPTPSSSLSSTPPPAQLLDPIASLPSRRPPRHAELRPNVPPPGWSVEVDRREELLALSELTLNRKC